MTEEDNCPYNKQGRHYFTNAVGSGVKADFEPVEFGASAADTLYRRVEYSLIGCNCGVVLKEKVRVAA